jgi:hypothetical protein
MAFLPIVTAALGAYQAIQQSNAQKFNAQVATNESNLSINQANAQEGMVRRQSRQHLGAQEAAFGAAGVGYGGSSEVSLDQSAINQELDALNTRYKGSLTGYGYRVQSGQDTQAANQYSLMAGASLLKGIGSNYSYAPNAGGGTPAPATYYPGTPGGGT